MELKIKEYQLPEKISFNFEELKQELTEKVSHYETLVYTDDQIKEAKADKAQLNKLKKALNDERIRMEREYMHPFNEFKSQVNEIIGIIDKPVSVIDKQVKAYEEKQKQEKRKTIEEYFDICVHHEWLKLEQIFDEKWLNASVSFAKVRGEIDERLDSIENDIATLSNLPEFGFEATAVYKSTLDMNKAISEAQRMSQIAKAKAEREAEQARLAAEDEAKKHEEAENVPENPSESLDNPPVPDAKEIEGGYYEPDKQWISFKALLTVDDATELKQFFESRNIQFEAV